MGVGGGSKRMRREMIYLARGIDKHGVMRRPHVLHPVPDRRGTVVLKSLCSIISSRQRSRGALKLLSAIVAAAQCFFSSMLFSTKR